MNFEYITKQGQRWDQVAFAAYGKAALMAIIIAANPTVAIYDKLPAGIVLQIPVLEEVSVQTDAELLPPWKRQGDLTITGVFSNVNGTSSPSTPVLNGTKGDKGDKGDRGAKGDKGDPGPMGPQGPKGDPGDGATGTGLKGDPGDSAYQEWLSLGNTGTLQDFINSLKGEQGIPGPKGDAGDTGPQGIQGVAGPQGPKGDTGAQGPVGPTGSFADVTGFYQAQTVSTYADAVAQATGAQKKIITVQADENDGTNTESLFIYNGNGVLGYKFPKNYLTA